MNAQTASWSPRAVPALPYSGNAEETRRFNRFLFATLFPALLAGAVVPHLPRPEIPAEIVEIYPPRLVKLRFEPEPEPPPVVEPAPAPTPVVAPEPAPQPAPAATSAARRHLARAPEKKPVDRSAQIRKSLEKLRENPAILSSLSNRPLKQVVSADQPKEERLSADLQQGAAEVGRPAPRREKSEVELSGHSSTRVSTPSPGTGQGTSTRGKPGGGGGSGRSSQEIQSVFDRNKAAINNIYERALRNNPHLAGKIVLRITIQPDGSVSACQLHSSSLADDDVVQRVMRRVRLFNFGNKQVPAVTIDYPIEFFPR